MSRDSIMPFGKYKGETLEEIYIHDHGYLDWMLEQRSNRQHIDRYDLNDDLSENIKNCFKEMRNVRIYK